MEYKDITLEVKVSPEMGVKRLVLPGEMQQKYRVEYDLKGSHFTSDDRDDIRQQLQAHFRYQNAQAGSVESKAKNKLQQPDLYFEISPEGRIMDLYLRADDPELEGIVNEDPSIEESEDKFDPDDF